MTNFTWAGAKLAGGDVGKPSIIAYDNLYSTQAGSVDRRFCGSSTGPRKSRGPQARPVALPPGVIGQAGRRLWACPAKRLRRQAAGRRSPLTALQISPSGRRCQRLCRLTCGKPAAFRPIPAVRSSTALAGRLSLPASAVEVVLLARPAERQSLSASQAAKPQVVADANQRNLDNPGPCYSLPPRSGPVRDV
jgi:hypothetical protein